MKQVYFKMLGPLAANRNKLVHLGSKRLPTKKSILRKVAFVKPTHQLIDVARHKSGRTSPLPKKFTHFRILYVQLCELGLIILYYTNDVADNITPKLKTNPSWLNFLTVIQSKQPYRGLQLLTDFCTVTTYRQTGQIKACFFSLVPTEPAQPA